ncbi:hypothetical protein BJY24_005683 [Nocardia transvalensis]|uniref:Uncharacterized protein n=1 Tax=Nocardia transvalensis TaxID=37333 RepID=A0A7W9UKR7_9NOCA|nr:hypothetical protein [Nocardia transvalensis]MBB5916771.1 hypothetical protein [Nocardia transvalensis]
MFTPASHSPGTHDDDTWEEFSQAQRQRGAPIDEAYARAQSYAWGRQDEAGPEAADSEAAEHFAEAFAIHYAGALPQRPRSVQPLDRCWHHWITYGVVDLTRLPVPEPATGLRSIATRAWRIARRLSGWPYRAMPPSRS